MVGGDTPADSDGPAVTVGAKYDLLTLAHAQAEHSGCTCDRRVAY